MEERILSSYQAEPARKCILLVEDDPANAALLYEVISRETSHYAFVVSDGAAALQFVRRTRPHLLLLDYLLPDMNGLELYDRLYVMGELYDVPALLISAASFHFEPDKRPITLMTKPFDLDELLATIETLLSSLHVVSGVNQIE